MKYISAPWRERYVKRGSRQPGCVFCDAVRRGDDRAALIVHRGRHNFVILNRYPYTIGHVMIAPYRHLASFTRTSRESAEELADLLKLSLKVLERAYHPEGFNAGMNFGRSAGAGIVDHYHLHVIPRWPGDANFMPIVGRTRVVHEDLDKTWSRLKPLFEKETAGRPAGGKR